MVEEKISSDSVGPHDHDECSKAAFKEDEVESARAEMSEVREENARLKMLLEKIEQDYQSLQMRFVDVCQTEPAEANKYKNDDNDAPSGNEDIVLEEPELVSLCLGRSPSEPKKQYDNASSSSLMIKTKEDQRYHWTKAEGDLKLGLDLNSLEEVKADPRELQMNPSPENTSALEPKEEESRETWPPSKVLKPVIRSGDDDLSQASVKRARVSVRARCDTPTMNDGCQWRKYGQKIAKGNPCPRAYYRCTVAPSCPVRKQVQRCAEDMSILITTYEGTHNHPLSVSATAMASTTSAAASMLLSGSSSSRPGLGSSAAASNDLNSPLHGLNANLSADTSKSQSYYLPNSSSPPFPTITLDLTNNLSTSSNQFNMFSSTSFQSTPRLTSTSLSFAPSQPSVLSSVWGNGNLNYGANALIPYGKINQAMSSSLQHGRTSQEHLYQPYIQKNYQAPSQQAALTETLTKAITSDPSFRSVIAAAITTMVGGGGGANAIQANKNKYESLGNKLKWDDKTKVINSSKPLGPPNGNGCASSFLNQSSSSSSSTPQSHVSLTNQQPQPAFSISNATAAAAAASATTSDNGDRINGMVLE